VERADDTRIEFEASWRGSSAEAPAGVAASDLDVSYYSLMVNAYKDFEITPVNNLDAFIGFGIGVSIANLSGSINYNPTRPGTTFGGHIPETGEAALAYQMMLGASYRYSNDLSLIMAYRLFNTEDFNHYNPDPVHMFEIGIRKDL